MITQKPKSLPTTPSQVSSLINKSYQKYLGLGGLIVRARPYICPFEEILHRINYADKILDVGCGTGSLSFLIASCNLAANVQGIDISSKPIQIAHRAKSLGAGRVHLQVCQEGSWPDDLYDTVICVDVIHHVKVHQQKKFIHNLCHKVKPGGQLIIKDISPFPRWKALANTAHDIIMSNQWVSYLHEQSIEQELINNNFTIKESVRLDRLWYSHYLINASKSR